MKHKAILLIALIGMMVLGCSSAVFAETGDGYVGLPDKYQKIEGITDTTVMGIDMTNYRVETTSWEKTLGDYRGNKKTDAQVFKFLKKQGINTVSVMITVKDGDYGLTNAIKTLKAAKDAGLETNAVLTFSDELTYKGHQPLPEGWTADNAEWEAEQYVKTVIGKFKEEGASLDMITVGNEIDYNFLEYKWESDDVDNTWKTWEALGKVTKAIHDTNSDIKIAINFAAPQDADGVQWFVSGEKDNLNTEWCASTYNYVSITYYPWDAEHDYAADKTYLDELKAKYEETQWNAKKQPLILNTNVSYVTVEDSENELNKYDIHSQMDGIYAMMQNMDMAGGMIYRDEIYKDENYKEGEGEPYRIALCGGWKSVFTNEGNAMPALGLFGLAKAGQTDAVIDTFQFGGDPGTKDLPVTIEKIPGMAENSIRGVDASSCIALEKAGVKFYDKEGSEADLFDVLEDHGVNYIRIRIWNDPKNAEGQTYGGGACDVATGLEMASRAKDHDMKVLLCFHYSDFWADPYQQFAPKEWQADVNNPKAIENRVYQFTKETVKQFVETGADIGMVQVGNEITRGMIGINDTWDKVWKNTTTSKVLNGYLKVGSKAVREEAPNALIALHLESPNVDRYNAIMSTWKRDGVDYDVLGTSCYPFWGKVGREQNPENVIRIEKLAADYGKLFCILETAWPYTIKEGDGTANTIGENNSLSAYKVSPQGQADCLSSLYKAVVGTENGLGIFYWEPAWIPVRAGWINWHYNKYIADIKGTGWASVGAKDYSKHTKMYYNDNPSWGGSSWENNALFDINGHPLGSLSVYKDSISKGQEEIVKIQPVDEKGTIIAAAVFAKVELGKSRTITLSQIKGYKLISSAKTITVKGSKAGVTLKKVAYKKLVVSKGQSVKKNGQTYLVTKVASGKTLGTVSFVTAKNRKTVTVPATVKLGDKKTYKVTVVKTGAFKAKRIRSVVLGKNVTRIEKKAFAGSKATKIIVKTKKLKKARVKGSLKGSKIKTISVKVGKKKANRTYVKKYKKIFKKSNSGKKVKVK